jgi:hypothetical protein
MPNEYGTTYWTATADGLLFAGTGSDETLVVFFGPSSTAAPSVGASNGEGLTVPLRAGDTFWLTNFGPVEFITWLPFGTGVPVLTKWPTAEPPTVPGKGTACGADSAADST